MTEFGYNEPDKGSLKNIPLNIIMIIGLFLLLFLGAIGVIWLWFTEEH